MNYYKATRPDGWDFMTGGTFDYAGALASGEVVKHPAAKKVRDEASTYISVSVSAADCTGFEWPCRLFRVEPVGRVMTRLSASPNKRAISALRVAEELPAWQALGPNGKEVAALIERAKRLTADEVRSWYAARYAARDAVRDDAAWYAAWRAARDAAREAAWCAARDARYAARYAAVALVVRDRLAAGPFDSLYGPWASAIDRQDAQFVRKETPRAKREYICEFCHRWHVTS